MSRRSKFTPLYTKPPRQPGNNIEIYPGKNLANSYLEKAQPSQPVAVKHYEVHTRAQLMHGRARIDK